MDLYYPVPFSSVLPVPSSPQPAPRKGRYRRKSDWLHPDYSTSSTFSEGLAHLLIATDLGWVCLLAMFLS